MFHSIWKYEIRLDKREASVRLPVGAKVLSIQEQHDKPMLWALVDTEETETYVQRYTVVGTGHKVSPSIEPHVATVQLQSGYLVLHFFEKSRL